MGITPDQGVEAIRQKFTEKGGEAKVPLQGGHAPFKARLIDRGIEVSNLGTNKFLPWWCFRKRLNCSIVREGGRGEAMQWGHTWANLRYRLIR